MPIPIPDLQHEEDQLEALKALPLATEAKLAAYLKSSYGKFLHGMTDEDWLVEAMDVLEAIGGRRT